jgi:CheY-like chemotaxis protein
LFAPKVKDVMKADVKGRVLCVEDNYDDCELNKEILNEYEVTCVPTIAEACPLLEKNKYELVIVDVHLPDGSGLSLCGTIGKMNSDTPILIVTGDAYITNYEAVRAGAKVLLTKSKVNYVEELKLFAGRYALSANA